MAERFESITEKKLISYFITQRESGEIRLCSGLMFKLPGDDRPFPEVTELQIEKSLLGLKPWTMVYDVLIEESVVRRVYGASDLSAMLNIGLGRAEKIKTETRINGYTVKPLVS